MRILITGASGFVGSELLVALAGAKHELFSLGRQRPERRELATETAVGQVFCDLRDPAAIRQVLRRIQPEIVIHLASVSPVAYSYDHPNEVVEANLMGTINLSEACHSEVPHLRQFLFASTSETYGIGPIPKTEETPQNPGSPYAVSKLAAEKYLLYLRDAFAFPLTVLRPFNTYGRKDTAAFVVERIVWQMLHEDTVKLGDPEVVRDWLYIDDHVGAYLACLGNKRTCGQIFNFCTGRGVCVRELVDLLSQMTGFRGEVEWNSIPRRPLDNPTVVGDPSKAEQLLGWHPRFDLEKGLHMVVDFWRRKEAVATSAS
jgi:nucleoside-diphosphate-sugar epimerase